MAVTTLGSVIVHAGDGTSTSFAIPFRFMAATDLRVVRRVPGAADAVLLLNADYSVAGAGVQSGGTLTMTAAPTNGQQIVIERRTPRQQVTPFPPNNAFAAATIEELADRAVLMAQEDQTQLNGTLQLPAGEAGPLPLPSLADRRSRVLGFNAAGAPVAGPNLDLLQSLAASTSSLALDSASIVTTRAAMTALPKAGLVDSMAVQCLGGATISDGEGGLYYWNATSTLTPDGELVLAADEGGTGRWLAAMLSLQDAQLRGDLAQPGGFDLVRGALGSVATRAAMAALTPWAGRAVFLAEGLRAGVWECVTGAVPVTDTLEGLYKASTTAGFHWRRVWDGYDARPEWWGAQPGNGAFDSGPALQAAIDVGKRVRLTGLYYANAGLVGRAGTVIEGDGPLQSGIFTAHATDHLIQFRGVSGVSYLEYPRLSNFALIRTVNPTTPAAEADDITQGHGIHMFMVTNPIIDNVYTYNNLVEVYGSNILTMMFRNVRGLRQTGGAGDRWYGLWLDGVTGGGTFGGPSPNPSAHVSYFNMVGFSPVGRSWAYLVRGASQDFWMDFFEAGGNPHVGLFVDAGGANSGDVRLSRAVLDGYRTMGAHFKNVPQGSSIKFDGWVAPAASATGDGIRIEASHGLNVQATGDFQLAPTRRMLNITDSSLLHIDALANNCITACYGLSVNSSQVSLRAHKNIAGGGASGSIADFIGGSDNRIILAGTTISQAWVAGFAADATIDGYTVDVSMVLPAAVTNRVTNAGSAVTTQGNVGWGGGRFNTIINPRAGAMA